MARRPPLGLDPIAEAKRQWNAHGWDPAAPGMTAVTSIMRAHQILLARVDETLKPFRLTFARYELLTLLSFSSSGRMPMASASTRLQVHPTSVTNTVDRLEAAGLVARERNPADGRGVLVVLTASGRALAAEATAALNSEVFEDVGLGAQDLDDLAAIIARLRDGAGDRVDGAS